MNLLVIVQQSAHSLRTRKGIRSNTQVALLSDLHRVKSWVATLLEHVEHLLHTAVHNRPVLLEMRSIVTNDFTFDDNQHRVLSGSGCPRDLCKLLGMHFLCHPLKACCTSA